MFKNNLKIALRNLLKQRSYTLINLFGLGIGLACTILIALWIQRELSVDQFHVHQNELFKVREHQTYGDDVYTYSSTPVPLADELKANFAEITHVSRMDWGNYIMISRQMEQGFYEIGHYVDPDFLKMFSFSLVKGDLEKVLTQPEHILITEELAAKYFANENPLGQILTLNSEEEYTVAGVLKDVPKASTIRFDFLLPFANFIKKNQEAAHWGNNMVQTYFRTIPDVTATDISKKIAPLVADHGSTHIELVAHAAKDWYLRANFEDKKIVGGNIDRVRLFGIIAIFILLIAGINFVNLVTAKSTTRAKEVGVRKVMGASRPSLMGQFICESTLLTFLASILGITLLYFALPYFNDIFNLELSLFTTDKRFWLGIASIIFVTGLLAGVYPSVVLTRFRPVKVLKNQLATGNSSVQLRKVLVTAQFVISILLIISTIIVYQQVELIKNKDLGYEKENLLQIQLNEESYAQYDILKNQLAQLPDVVSVSSTSKQIHSWGNNTSDVSWEGKAPETNILFQTIPTDYNFLQTIGAKLHSGRDFSPAFASDSTNFIINETAAQVMGLDNPVGKTISLWGTEGRVIGLAKDFHVNSIRDKQSPVLLYLNPPERQRIYLKLTEDSETEQVISDVEKIFTKHSPSYPFNYAFVDDMFLNMHGNEQRTGALARIFTFLAILVSCLGLFGLAAFATQQRRREIGIRKVLGASVTSIVRLLSKDFILLVLLAFVIATPIAYYFISDWLTTFAYRVNIQWWVFAAAGFLALSIAFLTVSFQSIKAAMANPIHSLKDE